MTNPHRHTPRLPHSAFFDRIVPIVLVVLAVLLVVVILAVILWPAAGVR